MLVLRAATAIATALEGFGRLSATTGMPPEWAFTAGGAFGVLWIAAGALITLGIFTTPVLLMIAAGELGVLVTQGRIPLPAYVGATATTHLLITALSIGLSLIGPGAYSIDARLFGRREIIIRPRSRPPTD